jgi:DNA-binding LacI/PurR family transcriptional regulator
MADDDSRKLGKSITIKTVAEDAGVSVAAVSKVLRNAYGVSDVLRAKVQASMERLSYRPRAAARAMRGQTYTLGVLLPDLHNPFFSDIMGGANTALERTQYQALFGTGLSVSNQERGVVEAMIDRQMDGLLLIAPRLPLEEMLEIGRRVPSVVLGLHIGTDDAFDTVNNDDHMGGRLAVRHLIENGYRNIAFISLDLPRPVEFDNTFQRELGYRAEMVEHGLTRYVRVIPASQTSREIQITARHLLESRQRPEAVFCWTDGVAMEVLSVARELGLDVPRDLAVVGYDNTSYCDMAQNALTSIDQSGQVLGLQAIRLLIERVKGRRDAEHFVVTPRLVARNSTSPRKA